jgi:hypothetical protein
MKARGNCEVAKPVKTGHRLWAIQLFHWITPDSHSGFTWTGAIEHLAIDLSGQ